MPEQIALIETPVYETTVYETTGARGERVVHELCRFEMLGTLVRAFTNTDGDTLLLSVGSRRFELSLIDLAATAALAAEAHLRREIADRMRASAATGAASPSMGDHAIDALAAHLFGDAREPRH